MAVETRYRHGNQWKAPTDMYAGHGGVWKKVKSKLIAHNGKWVEAFDNEGADPNPFINVNSVSYRGGTAGQSDLLLKGNGLSGLISPKPADFAFYAWTRNFTDSFENFPNMIPVNMSTADFEFNRLVFDGTNQYVKNPSDYDQLGLLGNDGKRYWMVSIRGIIQDMPSDSVEHYLMYTGGGEARLAIGYTHLGEPFVSWTGAGGTQRLSLGQFISAGQEFSLVAIHDNGTLTLRVAVVVAGVTTYYQQTMTINPTTYFIPTVGAEVWWGRGESPGVINEIDAFFTPSNCSSLFVITDDVGSVQGISFTSSGSSYRSSQPGRTIDPGTGTYYIEVLNNNSYDIHVGFAEPGIDLENSVGVNGWAFNTINGRKFDHQVGGGTAWSTAIAANSTIGVLYDSNAGSFEVFVDNVSRGKPFPDGSITVPVRFAVGGRSNTVSQPMVVTVNLDSTSWVYPKTASRIPKTGTVIPGADTYIDGAFNNVVIRNAPMTDGWLDTFLDPQVQLEVIWRDSNNVEHNHPEYVIKKTETELSTMIPRELSPGNYELFCRLGSEASRPKQITVDEFKEETEGLDIDFANTSLSEIDKALMIAHKQWGGINGGVIKENVYWDKENGVLICNSLGDQYTGPLRGVDRFGKPTTMSTRMGGCVVTRGYYGPASYRVIAKLPQQDGVVSAFWTFHYEETYPATPPYDEFLAEGLHLQGNEEAGYYIVRNHEIDIEIPTALKTDPDMEVVSYRNARFNSWQGELRNWDVPETDPEYWTEYIDDFVDHGVDTNDGQFHEFRFDWHTAPTPKVEFYIDGVLKNTITEYVPDIPGRFWVGLWFPSSPGNHWAGKNADWVSQAMEIKRIQIIPYEAQAGTTRLFPESYPNDVFRTFYDNNSGETRYVL